MRFLGIGDSCDLGSLYRRLVQDGHRVRVHIANPMCRGTMAGIIEQTADWRAELDWIAEAGPDGIILFENVAERRGGLQDELRRQGFNVIGGSAYGDRLENDRGYAQEVLRSLGFPICATYEFGRPDDAFAFLDAHPARYVLKFNGPGFASSDNYVGRCADAADIRALLLGKQERILKASASFILMEHVKGVEMGVGAYFDGEKFLAPACLDWEHKRFFPGDMGELTGEMGTVVTYARTDLFFSRTLGRMTPLLREHGYQGYINLNTIVNEQGIWPLEFTCRFGYPGFAILDPLQRTSWGDIFAGMVRRDLVRFETDPGFALGLVLTTPPFPYTRHQIAEPVGLPVFVSGEMDAETDRHLHYGEVGLENGSPVTSGVYGWTMVVTGIGSTIETARCHAYALADRVSIPNLRYRNDIGDRLIHEEFAHVEALGLLDKTDGLNLR